MFVRIRWVFALEACLVRRGQGEVGVGDVAYRPIHAKEETRNMKITALGSPGVQA